MTCTGVGGRDKPGHDGLRGGYRAQVPRSTAAKKSWIAVLKAAGSSMFIAWLVRGIISKPLLAIERRKNTLG